MASLVFNSPSIFAIHTDLDGEKPRLEFADREQFIGLMIGVEEFLLPILSIREIILLPEIAFVPNAPEFIEGVINLRGTILPSINLRKMMGMPVPEKIHTARVVVAKHDQVAFGLIVDGITNVVSLLPHDVQKQNLPRKGTGAEFIGAICKQGLKVKGILDLSRIMARIQMSITQHPVDQTST